MSKRAILCLSFLCLMAVGRYCVAPEHFSVYADDDPNTSVEQDNSENSSNVSEDDYRIPKTVYIGVDSIAAPKSLPESVAEDKVSVDDQSTTSTTLSATEDQPTSKVEAVSQNNESDNPQTEVVAGVADKNPKAPEIKQAKTNSINNVSKRITLFKSIDVESELDVPSGLPEDLTQDQDPDLREETTAAQGGDAVETPESQTAKADDESDAVEQAETEQTTEDGKQPAIVVNLARELQIDSQNEWGWTKLMSAAIEGNLNKVSELLGQGANPDIVGDDGRSPLMAASWNKHYQVVESLISAGADVNLRNRDGWTALSFAAWNGDVVIVKSLLAVSANQKIKTADGYTPLQLAEQKGHQKIVELLQ